MTASQPIQTGDSTANGNEGHLGGILHHNNIFYGD